jgi:hypothetical protein
VRDRKEQEKIEKERFLQARTTSRRAIFASFGLGKSFIQLIIDKNCIKKENKPFLIACPLGVVGEFKRDNRKEKRYRLS